MVRRARNSTAERVGDTILGIGPDSPLRQIFEDYITGTATYQSLASTSSMPEGGRFRRVYRDLPTLNIERAYIISLDDGRFILVDRETDRNTLAQGLSLSLGGLWLALHADTIETMYTYPISNILRDSYQSPIVTATDIYSFRSLYGARLGNATTGPLDTYWA